MPAPTGAPLAAASVEQLPPLDLSSSATLPRPRAADIGRTLQVASAGGGTKGGGTKGGGNKGATAAATRVQAIARGRRARRQAGGGRPSKPRIIGGPRPVAGGLLGGAAASSLDELLMHDDDDEGVGTTPAARSMRGLDDPLGAHWRDVQKIFGSPAGGPSRASGGHNGAGAPSEQNADAEQPPPPSLSSLWDSVLGGLGLLKEEAAASHPPLGHAQSARHAGHPALRNGHGGNGTPAAEQGLDRFAALLGFSPEPRPPPAPHRAAHSSPAVVHAGGSPFTS